MKKARIGVLALQGAFCEHVRAVTLCGGEAVEVRRQSELDGLEGLILPGGESTVMGRLLVEWNLLEPVRALCSSGIPVLATCAGLILLCREILDHPRQPRLGLLDASVRRNAFGRQVDSFSTELTLDPFPGLDSGDSLEAVFIRAPLIERIGPEVRCLARVQGKPVAVRQGNLLALSFHPELTDDLRLHRWMVHEALRRSR